MLRFAIFMLFIPFNSVRSEDFNTCIEILTNSSECFDNNNVTAEYQNTDTAKCIACFATKNFFDGYDQSTVSCDEAKSDICGFLNQCQDACYPSVNVCQMELDNYLSCVYGVSYAPDGCVVQCDGTTSDGSNGDSNTNGGGTSASSMKVMPMIASSMLIAIAMVGNGLADSSF